MRKQVAVLVLLLPALLLPSCGTREVDTAAVLESMIRADAEHEIQTGVIYRKDSSPGSPDYLSERLLASLYGEGVCPEVFERVTGACIFLCSREAGTELAVFACLTPADAEEIASLCRVRAKKLKYHLGGESETLIYGNTLLFAFCGSAAEASRRVGAGRGALRHM